jgi:transposase
MPRPFPAEFRLRAVALVRAGKTITATAAAELGISTGALHNWVRQDQIDRGERPELTTHESAELAKAKKRIRQLEAEVEILKRAAKLLGEDRPDPKGLIR